MWVKEDQLRPALQSNLDLRNNADRKFPGMPIMGTGKAKTTLSVYLSSLNTQVA